MASLPQVFVCLVGTFRCLRGPNDNELPGTLFAQRPTIMDKLHGGSVWPRGEVSELLRDGLILWRLAANGHADLWCLIFEVPEGYRLVLDDDPNGDRPFSVCERHDDVVSLLKGAESLKYCLLARGWREVDVA